MTSKLFIFTIVLSLLYGCKDADINDSDRRNENWVYWIDNETGKASWVPVKNNESNIKNGAYTRFFNTGETYQKGKLKDGKDIDTIYCYNHNEEVIQYLIVKPDTLLNYYVKDGPYLSHFQNGNVLAKGQVKNHDIGDEWTEYYDNGQTRWTKELTNGTGWNYWYYRSGQLSAQNYHLNGKTDGQVKNWYENGQIKEISYWKEGKQDGMYLIHYENGQLEEQVNWINDERDGKSEMWYENGQKSEEAFYKVGKRDGALLQWHPNGNRKAILNFTSNEPDGKITVYFEDGRLKNEGYFSKGIRNGVFTEYDTTGAIVEKVEYVNGVLIE